ncbi:MAG: hypothetical protein GC181_12700 [Bacteroidetes bacterium]|nr:hypothetical protein [Bacteroidota bacterium]
MSSCKLLLITPINPVKGNIYTSNGDSMTVKMKSFKKLKFNEVIDSSVVDFLNIMCHGYQGRKSLKFILTSSTRITIAVHPEIGISKSDSTFHLLGGCCGPAMLQEKDSIENDCMTHGFYHLFHRKQTVMVYREATLDIFTGSFRFISDTTIPLDSIGVKIVDLRKNVIYDTLCGDSFTFIHGSTAADFMNSEKVFLYIIGFHEIQHLTPHNYYLKINDYDEEYDAMLKEEEAWKDLRRFRYADKH